MTMTKVSCKEPTIHVENKNVYPAMTLLSKITHHFFVLVYCTGLDVFVRSVVLCYNLLKYF
jgi:hypothetical protein